MTIDATITYLTRAAECERRLSLPECRERNRPIYLDIIAADLKAAAPSVVTVLPDLVYREGVGFTDRESGEVVETGEVVRRFKAGIGAVVDGLVLA